MIKYYTIEKNKLGKHTLWVNTESEHGYGCRGIITGNKKEIREYCRKNNITIRK